MCFIHFELAVNCYIYMSNFPILHKRHFIFDLYCLLNLSFLYSPLHFYQHSFISCISFLDLIIVDKIFHLNESKSAFFSLYIAPVSYCP